MKESNELKLQKVMNHLMDQGPFFTEHSNGHLKCDRVSLWATTEKWFDEETGEKGCGINSFIHHVKAKSGHDVSVGATRPFSVSYSFEAYGTVVIDVPAHFTEDEALNYAHSQIEELPLPDDWEYVGGSSKIDEENSGFSDEDGCNA